MNTLCRVIEGGALYFVIYNFLSTIARFLIVNVGTKSNRVSKRKIIIIIKKKGEGEK